MKLIDCTVYSGKPSSGIPDTIPGVYEGREWRTSPSYPEHRAFFEEIKQ